MRQAIQAFARSPDATAAQLAEVARLVDALGDAHRSEWSGIPHELWCEALAFLPASDVLAGCARACRGLRACAADPRSWRVLEMPAHTRRTGDPLHLLLLAAKNAFSHLGAVSLVGWPGAMPDELVAALFGGASLRAADLSGTAATDHTLLRVAASPAGPRLRSLRLRACDALSDVGLTYVARMRALRELDLSGCDITAAGLHYVAEACAGGLERLSLDGCDSVDDAALRDVAAACGRLRRLSLEDCALVTDAALEALADGCPLLERLRADGCARVGDAGLAALGAGATRELRAFSLSAAAGVTAAGVAALAGGCPLLEDLRLRWCPAVGDEACAALAAACRSLRVLHLSSCARVGDLGVRALAAAAAGTRRTLRELNLNRCARVSGVGACAAATGCEALEELHLVGCHRFTAQGLTQVPVRVRVRCDVQEQISYFK